MLCASRVRGKLARTVLRGPRFREGTWLPSVLIPQFAPEPPLRHNLVPLPVFPVELAPFPSARRIVYLKELRCTSVPSCAARSTALWRSRACRHFVRYAVMPVVKKNAVADLRRDAGRECAVPHHRIQK
jgi:hypothetical protein